MFKSLRERLAGWRAKAEEEVKGEFVGEAGRKIDSKKLDEVLYDLDIQAQEKAAQLGIRLERPPTLNDDSLFMEALADVIKDRARPWLAESRDTNFTPARPAELRQANGHE